LPPYVPVLEWIELIWQGKFVQAAILPFTWMLGNIFWTGIMLFSLAIAWLKTGSLLYSILLTSVLFATLGFLLVPEIIPLLVILGAIGFAIFLINIVIPKSSI